MDDDVTTPVRPPRGRRLKAAGLVAAGLVAGGLLAGTLTAGAQTPAPSPTATSDDKAGRAEETPLTGATAQKAKAAALEAVPGGTILRLETDADGAAYEAHMRKADGSLVTVKMDKDFKVTATEEGGDCGPGRHHGRHGGPRAAELTGETAEKAKAAALEAVPGGTVLRALAGPADGYHVHVRKSDGTHAVVELDKDLEVTATREHPGRMMPGQQS